MISYISTTSVGTSDVWSGASMKNYSQERASEFFNSVDSSASGTITQSQFLQSLKNTKLPDYAKSLSPTDLWKQLDPTGKGSITKQDFLNGLLSISKSRHKKHLNKAGESPSQTINSSLNALNSLSNKSQSIGSTVDAKV